MNKFWIEFFLGINTVSLLPCWLLAAVWYRAEHGHWHYVSPDEYAEAVAARRDWLCMVIAIALWVLPVIAAMSLRSFF